MKHFHYLFICLLVFGSEAFAKDYHTQIVIDHYSIDKKSIKGEVCDNLEDKPYWEKIENSSDYALRFGPHVFFSGINEGKITEKEDDCTREEEVSYNKNLIEKKIVYKCKDKKMNFETIQKIKISKDQLVLNYLQKTKEKNISSSCHFNQSIRTKK